MTEMIYGVFKMNNSDGVDLWTSFKTRKEALNWIGSNRYSDKYDVKEILSTEENLEFLYRR